ncbi:sulfatase-like hydrolase/transferase [Mucilaginibacter sp. FT3.2]|uniref:sulfatase-like hydrolase/transferase n=1 Tax=Mucilaginibacter sp. FT3.2 TaxID=2723090 RepID=UPI001792B470|nr:hypothetical protein [Mucilaginibacter sp. FT3.2]
MKTFAYFHQMLGMALMLLLPGLYAHAQKKPNIIYIYADDLGYGELGSYGQQKIKTPFLDQMAREGIRFTQHYTSTPVCAPARCNLNMLIHLMIILIPMPVPPLITESGKTSSRLISKKRSRNFRPR